MTRSGLARADFLAGALVGVLSLAGAAAASPPGLGPPDASLNLDVSKGRLIRLVRPASWVFIGDPRIADVQVKSPTLIYVIGKGAGETSLMAVDDRDATVANMVVKVGYDLDQLRLDIKRLLPGADVDIQVSDVHNALVLSGAVGSPGEAETAKTLALRFVPDAGHLVNVLQVDGPNQVNLRVRMVEVSRDIIKAFGVNLTGAAQPGQFTFGAVTGVGGITSTSANTLATAVPGLSGLTNILAAFQSGRVSLDAVIDALDSEGLVTVLAEPNLTAVSGAKASFLAGGEYPIPVAQGLGEIAVTYKQYGVSLTSVATITDEGRISLTVMPEVSQLSTTGEVTVSGTAVPALTTRRAQTTVDLASGQSFVIAGLMLNDITHQIQKVPGLGNLPGLGQMFRSDRLERNESEILIIVTPYIVRPSARRLAVPTDGYIAPTDKERLIKGADYSPTPAAPVETPAGPVKVGHP